MLKRRKTKIKIKNFNDYKEDDNHNDSVQYNRAMSLEGTIKYETKKEQSKENSNNKISCSNVI